MITEATRLLHQELRPPAALPPARHFSSRCRVFVYDENRSSYELRARLESEILLFARKVRPARQASFLHTSGERWTTYGVSSVSSKRRKLPENCRDTS